MAEYEHLLEALRTEFPPGTARMTDPHLLEALRILHAHSLAVGEVLQSLGPAIASLGARMTEHADTELKRLDAIDATRDQQIAIADRIPRSSWPNC